MQVVTPSMSFFSIEPKIELAFLSEVRIESLSVQTLFKNFYRE